MLSIKFSPSTTLMQMLLWTIKFVKDITVPRFVKHRNVVGQSYTVESSPALFGFHLNKECYAHHKVHHPQ